MEMNLSKLWETVEDREAWYAVQFSSVQSLSRVRLCATPWTAAHQAPPSMGFSRQEYWSGVPFTSPRVNTRISLSKGDLTFPQCSHFLLYRSTERLCLCPLRICFPQSCGSSVIKSCCPSESDSLGIPSPFAESPGSEV